MVGDDEKIERSLQPRELPRARAYRLSFREPVRVVGPDSVSGHPGVGGVGRVDMGVAEVDLCREVLVDVGRVVAFRPRKTLFCGADVLAIGNAGKQIACERGRCDE